MLCCAGLRYVVCLLVCVGLCWFVLVRFVFFDVFVCLLFWLLVCVFDCLAV